MYACVELTTHRRLLVHTRQEPGWPLNRNNTVTHPTTIVHTIIRHCTLTVLVNTDTRPNRNWRSVCVGAWFKVGVFAFLFVSFADTCGLCVEQAAHMPGSFIA